MVRWRSHTFLTCAWQSDLILLSFGRVCHGSKGFAEVCAGNAGTAELWFHSLCKHLLSQAVSIVIEVHVG
jgi:hypothetical protein